jgi:Asp-tRNA(Asn)/Glu-tRNA(Gln) amidotransferase A subunit family amidase
MLNRRIFLDFVSELGLASTLFPGVLWAIAEKKKEITSDMIDQAAAIAGIAIPDEAKSMLVEGLSNNARRVESIRALRLPNSVAPALVFDPVLPGMKFAERSIPMQMSSAPAAWSSAVPKNLEGVAFYSVRRLAELIRTKRVSSQTLTQMYLDRLRRYDPLLKFAVTLTENRALAKAKEVDRDLSAGKYRGPLHGIPWGAKDLLAVKGYPTTWGAGGFENQSFDEDATVVKRLDAAGAVLIAKLTLGALAMGDKWFGGRTRNPWNSRDGSSGSSAGSGSATAAGCVGFSLGSETLGSISSPSTRCGATGLRPTFGMVPRTGAMALSWSMDKIGPICRSVEDCALVLNAIYGPDGLDRTVRRVAFNWDAHMDWRRLRVGYLRSEFDPKPPEPVKAGSSQSGARTTAQEQSQKQQEAKRLAAARHGYDRQFDLAALSELRSMGLKLIELELPKLPYEGMMPLLVAEAAAAFDELTRSGRDKLLTEQGKDDWPNLFRVARFYPAVDYINANRARLLLMENMAKLFTQVDVIVAPTDGDQLVATNLTGHPAVILPNGFRGKEAPVAAADDLANDDAIGGPGTPVSLTFIGNLYGEAKLLALAKAYQDATGFHLKYPILDRSAKT